MPRGTSSVSGRSLGDMARQQLPPQIRKVDLKTGTRYEVVVDTGSPDGRRTQTRRRFRTEREAKVFLVSTAAAVDTGTFVRPTERTLAAACQDWLAAKHNLKASTRRNYEVALQPVVDTLGAHPIQRIRKRDLDDLVAKLRAGEVEDRRAYKARSVNKLLMTLGQVLESELRQGHVVRNVAALVERIPVDAPVFRTLTEAEAVKVMDHVCRDRVAWVLALSGLRRGEIAGLKWQHVDLEAGTLTIADTRTPVTGLGIVDGTPKSRSSRRTLPLPDDLAAVLKAARRTQAAERLAMGAAYQGGEYVVCDEAGRPRNPAWLYDHWARMLAELEIPRVRLHDARHSCATLMHLKGVPIAVIAAWLGHASAAFTLATYAHSQPDALKAAADALRGSASGL